jgi:hypothetical protein
VAIFSCPEHESYPILFPLVYRLVPPLARFPRIVGAVPRGGHTTLCAAGARWLVAPALPHPWDGIVKREGGSKSGWSAIEGVVGPHALLGASPTPYLYMTLTRGTAHRIQAERLTTEFQRGGTLQNLFLRYTQARLSQFAQLHVCNYFHPIPKRICRWLLMVHDRAMANELSLTQQAISQVLRVRRTGITEAMGTLQKENLCSYHYGQITILDRGGLERTACECYETISHGFTHLPKSGSPHSGERSNGRLG